ncbi:hypothetical protein GCM10009416_40140 [Craurococcus roseus]|uniref:LGFP repeat-containing protein n=1 Tax=Craurococcus roseus TaxID=77585 RepID=A0ABN1FU59_9PROT
MAIAFDMDKFGRLLTGWDKKDGSAAEYKSSGSNYRTYKPSVANTGDGGLYLFTKLDHIRGMAKDDHAQIELTLGPDGQAESWRAHMQIQGNPQFDTGLVTSAAAFAGPKYAAIANVASKVLNSLSTFVAQQGEHGGRAAFPNVVQMNLLHMADCVEKRFAVYGFIGQKYAALGGESGFLGKPVTDETGTPDGVGRFNHFQGGSIYWTPKTGAWEVHGLIRDKWASMGWERSFLGYPVTDETKTPDGVGRFNHFQGGSIYWTPQTGAWEVHGLIREKWASLGWERSALGYPVSDEQDLPGGGGKFSQFQGGRIVWKPATGAQVVGA